MSDRMYESIKAAVSNWARNYYRGDDVVVYLFDDEDADPERVIAVLAVRGLKGWQAAEVWLEGDQVMSINDLGEGVPPEDVTWPWPD